MGFCLFYDFKRKFVGEETVKRCCWEFSCGHFQVYNLEWWEQCRRVVLAEEGRRLAPRWLSACLASFMQEFCLTESEWHWEWPLTVRSFSVLTERGMKHTTVLKPKPCLLSLGLILNSSKCWCVGHHNDSVLLVQQPSVLNIY